ncbi:MAG: outer membrane protein assembly factor BamC [Gammaproteobacteria bacterium]|nr:outer membrane protein assembly factor BamC [Gammaproteobacteria bacterium]
MYRSKFAVIVSAMLLTACSGNVMQKVEEALPQDRGIYKSSKNLPGLEIPPGLNSSGIRESLEIPGGRDSATLSEYQGKQRVASSATVLPKVAAVRVARSGDERWLVIDATPGQVWPRLREFFLETGFLIQYEDPGLGIMETDWAERREELPQGLIRSFLQKLSTAAYSFATRDKFRARLEHGAEAGTTEVYLSHRGAEEKSQGTTYVWSPRPSDPELEAEMLTRLINSLGVEQSQANEMVASTRSSESRALLSRDADEQSRLTLREGFSRAWRRTGLALDRVGFTVEDRDRSRGLFYVRYVDPLAAEKQEEGFFSKLKFWGEDEKPENNEFLISLVGGESTTEVVVLDTQGERDTSPTSNRILALLHEQLK